MPATIFFSLIIINLLICIAIAFDPRPTQDFCVADLNSTTKTNGGAPLPCKDPAAVTAADFHSNLLRTPGNTTNSFGAMFSLLGVTQVPGLNTLGLTVSRLDLAPGGYFPLHIHPRATEVFIVIQGKLEVGFITSSPDYKLYNSTLSAGDIFYVPPGLVHYQRNAAAGESTAAYNILNSQNPGINSIAHATFGAKHKIDSGYLASAYQLDQKIIRDLQDKSWI